MSAKMRFSVYFWRLEQKRWVLFALNNVFFTANDFLINFFYKVQLKSMFNILESL